MLVLTRKLGETVLLGDEVQVTVVGVTAEGVRLGFVAPREVPVLREELGPPAHPVPASAGDRAGLRDVGQSLSA